ncbi:MAG: hypothetical protein EOO75_13330 [Myxococcales bacterium]|nr:MAG: hypothetical protein EOO75_13330 [Myxococcales bacterium]
MVRSLFPSFGLIAAASGLVGCIVVTSPPPNGTAPTPAPAGNRSNVPVAGAAGAATVAPAAGTLATTATGSNGPKVTVDGKEYTTVSRALAWGSGDKNLPFKGFVYFTNGANTTLPNFDAATPVGVLFTSSFAASANPYADAFPGIDATRTDHFAIRYEGAFLAPMQGEYIFKLESDDGSRLVIDNLPLLTNDGIHGVTAKTSSVKLAPGPHNFRLEYFQGTRNAAVLRLTVTPPGGAEKPFGPVI